MSKHNVYSCSSLAKANELIRIGTLALTSGIGRQVFFIEENEYERDGKSPVKYYMIMVDADKIPSSHIRSGETQTDTGEREAMRAQAFIRGYLLGVKHGKAPVTKTPVVKGRRAKAKVIEDADTHVDNGNGIPSLFDASAN